MLVLTHTRKWWIVPLADMSRHNSGLKQWAKTEREQKEKNWRNRRWRRYRASGSAKLKISKSFSTTQKSSHTTQLETCIPTLSRPTVRPTDTANKSQREKTRIFVFDACVFDKRRRQWVILSFLEMAETSRSHTHHITPETNAHTHTHTPHGMCFYLWIMANTLLHHCLLRLTKVVKVVVRCW